MSDHGFLLRSVTLFYAEDEARRPADSVAAFVPRVLVTTGAIQRSDRTYEPRELSILPDRMAGFSMRLRFGT
jgi:hypothetical protein